jgi:DNA-binding NtrC family response regulator
MATVLLIGTEESLLEGLMQSIAAAGHRVRIMFTVDEGVEAARTEPPLVAVVERAMALADPSVQHLGVARGGVLLLYRASADHAAPPATPLSPALQRAALADLSLPLERHRLIALIQRVEERAQATGAGRQDTPPEHRAF